MSVISAAHHFWESGELQLLTASLSSATSSPWVFYTHSSKKRGRLWEQLYNDHGYPMSHDSAMKQITGYHARDSGFQSRSRHTRVIPGSFQLNVPIQPQTTIIKEPLGSQGIVYARYTYNSQYTLMIRKCQYNPHTPYSQQHCWVVTSKYHQGVTPCHS